MRQHLSVNPIACTGHGICAEMLPELIGLDEWGYPMVAEHDVPRHLAGLARRAVRLCPTLALRLEASNVERKLPTGGAGPLAVGSERRR
jgi:ferredoxin